MLALANSLFFLGFTVRYARKRKPCKTRHSTAQHGTAHSARYRTALRRSVELANLNEAGACLFVL